MSGPKYIYPAQRRIEVIGAMYAAGLGLWAGLGVFWSGVQPLAWTQWPIDRQGTWALFMILSSLIWAMGIRINGAWRCSACLRASGMTGHAILVADAAMHGNWSTATYTYACISVILGLGAVNAIGDARRAWLGLGWTTTH